MDLGAVVENWRLLGRRLGPAGCAAVVKADAYGLGAARVAPALHAAGCRRFFVAHPDEALAILPLLPGATVGVLNGLLPGTEAEMVASGMVPVLNHLGEIERWSAAARRLGRPLPAYVQLDTGMNRLGLGPDETDTLAAEPHRLDGIDLLAWISHLACADDPAHGLNETQRARFRDALDRLPPAPAALANSSGIFLGPHFHFDFARPGCALFGVNPTPHADNPMHPAIRLAARILQVRNVDSTMSVGYGAAHSVARRGKVATMAIGYADGYSRRLSAVGAVLLGGVRAPVIGRVSMDLVTVDVTDVPDRALDPGSFAEVIGPHRPVDEVAREAGTIGYEVLTSLGRRYHRVYIEPRDI
ncbi:alanine racemase [Arenibaculum sp.]|uniref:alanine racemase n=1 Tax=Arenibaculum sp. TaxID=2865862 RepID=UPI002E10C813|nr:alanine racemase [Arenibaculum sp.]